MQVEPGKRKCKGHYCNKKLRWCANDSIDVYADRVVKRGVASVSIVTTDFNPLTKTIRGSKEP